MSSVDSLPGSDHTSTQAIADIRHFNRFYTHLLGVLDEQLLQSGYSLTEARVLYEIAHQDGLTATHLSTHLGLDLGYLSRILKRFESKGLIERIPSLKDARQTSLYITQTGRHVYQPLNSASDQQIATLLGHLQNNDITRLVHALKLVEHLLGNREKPQDTYAIRHLRPGDIGWIVHRHGLLYAQEYGWDEKFEALVAQIAADFVQHFNPEYEQCWIAEQDNNILGSFFLKHNTDELAQLRLLYVEPAARGLGIGTRLVQEAIQFARLRNYRKIMLWTNDILISARRIYEAAGFQLVKSEPHHSFGKDLVGQYWELKL